MKDLLAFDKVCADKDSATALKAKVLADLKEDFPTIEIKDNGELLVSIVIEGVELKEYAKWMVEHKCWQCSLCTALTVSQNRYFTSEIADS
jgi:heterodisulfide reductase subunit C